MSFLSAFNVCASGLTAQRKRLDVASENIANIETTRTESGEPYRRKMVVLQEIGDNTTFCKGIQTTEDEPGRCAGS